jgi:hypothetical protein
MNKMCCYIQKQRVMFKSIFWTSSFPIQKLKHFRNVFYFCPCKERYRKCSYHVCTLITLNTALHNHQINLKSEIGTIRGRRF